MRKTIVSRRTRDTMPGREAENTATLESAPMRKTRVPDRSETRPGEGVGGAVALESAPPEGPARVRALSPHMGTSSPRRAGAVSADARERVRRQKAITGVAPEDADSWESNALRKTIAMAISEQVDPSGAEEWTPKRPLVRRQTRAGFPGEQAAEWEGTRTPRKETAPSARGRAGEKPARDARARSPAVEPAPATAAILTQWKAGETLCQRDCVPKPALC